MTATALLAARIAARERCRSSRRGNPLGFALAGDWFRMVDGQLRRFSSDSPSNVILWRAQRVRTTGIVFDADHGGLF
jgi:hypothetical protein